MIDLRDVSLPAQAVIEALDLRPHPEGGHYRETWRDAQADGGRGASTAILFLLATGERSHWHKVDADELWLWQAGGALDLHISADGRQVTQHLLGPEMGAQGLQYVVPRDRWQAAVPRGAWTLVSCVVAPAFRFEGFTLAPPGWRPGSEPVQPG